MLDWIFGSSKSQKKQQPKNQDQLSEDESWTYDFIKQYLISPIWRNPLLDFIQENCVCFQDTQQNKFEYTKIFKQFTGLSALLIQSIVQETGITERTLQKCIIKGLKSKSDKKIFMQVLLCDNFESFKRVMIAKNKQLEAEALKKMRDESKQVDKVRDQIDQKQIERQQIEKAIAMSLAMQQKAKQKQEEELNQAIRLSQISAKQQQKKEEKSKINVQKKSLLGDLPPLVIGTNKNYEPLIDYKQEKEKLDAQIKALKQNQKKQAENTEQRKKRLLEQRQLLKKKKQQEREAELKVFVQNKQATNIPNHQVSEQELLKRKNLMKRLKEQLKND